MSQVLARKLGVEPIRQPGGSQFAHLSRSLRDRRLLLQLLELLQLLQLLQQPLPVRHAARHRRSSPIRSLLLPDGSSPEKETEMEKRKTKINTFCSFINEHMHNNSYFCRLAQEHCNSVSLHFCDTDFNIS